jgi:hypothetical protein
MFMSKQNAQPLALVPVPGTSVEASTEIDPVPADVQALMDLFTTHLADVKFPDVDAASLRKHADDLRAEAKAVVRARAQLATAVAASDARLATLVSACARAIAYAKIFSESHPERRPIAEALAAISRPAVPALSVVKRRGRPPRQQPAQTTQTVELFEAPAKPCALEPAR